MTKGRLAVDLIHEAAERLKRNGLAPPYLVYFHIGREVIELVPEAAKLSGVDPCYRYTEDGRIEHA